MLYLTPPSTPLVREAIAQGKLGWCDSIDQGNARPPGVVWMADNSCFSDKWNWVEWWTWLVSEKPEGCLFAVAPDVMRDADATLERATPWLPRIRELGFPVAYVAQNGAKADQLPWEGFDVLFLGGDNAFKLSHDAEQLVLEAHAHGKHAHMGRVNSLRRLQLAKAWGCDSVDGTYVTFGPDKNLPKLLRYVDYAINQQSLWRSQWQHSTTTT